VVLALRVQHSQCRKLLESIAGVKRLSCCFEFRGKLMSRSESTGTGRFLVPCIVFAIIATISGVCSVNMYFSTVAADAAKRKLSETIQTARQAIDEKKWDQAIELLRTTKDSIDLESLDVPGREMMTKLGRLVSEAENARSEHYADIDRKEATLRADRLLLSSEEAIRDGNLTEAATCLRRYMASPGANASARAKLLLDAINIANSDTSAVDFLSLLSENDFLNFGEHGTLPGSLNHIDIDNLRVSCKERLQANLTAAKKRRDALALETLRETTAQRIESRDKELLEADYDRDISKIKARVLADTIRPESARFCNRFDVIRNKRGNKVYVGWYQSRSLDGQTVGRDSIIAELNDHGGVLKLEIGTDVINELMFQRSE
jgi:hypothetical protein